MPIYRMFYFLPIFILFLCDFIAGKNLPIVLVHGILSNEYAMIPTKKLIEKYLPNAYVKSVTLGAGKITSLFNMHNQVEWLKKELQEDENLQQGCIIIGHSQGGLVARYFIEKYNKPRVYVYISWGTPQSGVFGAPGNLDSKFTWLQKIEQYSYLLLYSWPFQRMVSFAGYWKDPLHYEIYLKKSQFLPYLNNEIEHAQTVLFKKNICSLISLVFVQSTHEDIVQPALSCHAGFYKIGSATTFEELFETEWYNSDALGLKTLHESKRLHLRFAHCSHTQFQEDEFNFLENTLPFLEYAVPFA